MTVGELIKQLQAFDENDIVIIQKDAEGNDYSPLSDLGFDNYVADSTWSGHMANQDADFDEDEDYGQEDVEYETENSVPCVVLCPVN